MNNKIEKLVKKANNKNSWKIRLEALNEIKDIDCQQRKDVVVRLAIHDRVYKVKHAAFLIAQKLEFTKNGRPITLGKKDTGYKSSDFTKTFNRIKRETKMEELDLEEFKKKFLQINPEMYDVMEFDKGAKFDDWIKNIYASLPKK